ncbi:MAG: acetyltransferase [Verrucomicrobia bacterium]|nr:acetyltransferase [Verrucomicrobiota bacterium]
MSKVVLFGAGKIAEEVSNYLSYDSPHEVVAFTLDGAYVTGREQWGRPVVPFEEIVERYPPGDFKMFVAVGYQELNQFRARKYAEAKAKGYELISYVCSRAANLGGAPIGDNSLVLEHSVIQTTARVGSNVFVWSGNHIGHHATIQDHCYICGQVVVGGSSVVESYCLLGINSTIGHEVKVGAGSLIGAGALITRSVPANSVHIMPETPRFRLGAADFLRLTKMK